MRILIYTQIGYTCIILLLEVLIADVTSSRSRLLFSFVPALPFVVSKIIAGTMVQKKMKLIMAHLIDQYLDQR